MMTIDLNGDKEDKANQVQSGGVSLVSQSTVEDSC